MEAFNVELMPEWREVPHERVTFDLRTGPTAKLLNSCPNIPFRITLCEPWSELGGPPGFFRRAELGGPPGFFRVHCLGQPQGATDAYHALFRNHPEAYDPRYNNFVLYSRKEGRGEVICLRYLPEGNHEEATCLHCRRPCAPKDATMGCNCGEGHVVCGACYAQLPHVFAWTAWFPAGHSPWHKELGNVALWLAAQEK